MALRIERRQSKEARLPVIHKGKGTGGPATEDAEAPGGEYVRQGARREGSGRPFGDSTCEICPEYLIAVRRICPQACCVDGVLRAVRGDRPGAEPSVFVVLVLGVYVPRGVDRAHDPRNQRVMRLESGPLRRGQQGRVALVECRCVDRRVFRARRDDNRQSESDGRCPYAFDKPICSRLLGHARLAHHRVDGIGAEASLHPRPADVRLEHLRAVGRDLDDNARIGDEVQERVPVL